MALSMIRLSFVCNIFSFRAVLIKYIEWLNLKLNLQFFNDFLSSSFFYFLFDKTSSPEFESVKVHIRDCLCEYKWYLEKVQNAFYIFVQYNLKLKPSIHTNEVYLNTFFIIHLKTFQDYSQIGIIFVFQTFLIFLNSRINGIWFT